MTQPALPFLLRTRHPITELQPHSRDFQVRVGRPRRQPIPADAPACVLILTRTADQEIDELSLQLAARGIPMVRVDADRCTQAPTLWDPVAGTLQFDGAEYRPVVSWRRYFDAQAVRQPATVWQGGQRLVTQYTQDQWSAWGHAMASSAIRHINRSAAVLPPDRLTQLRAAAATGLRTPATIITSTPAIAAERIAGSGDLLLKSLGHHAVEAQPGRLQGVYPRRVTRDALRTTEFAEPAPVLVQEFIEAERELRVYIVGGEMFAYAVTRPSPESLWTAPDSIKVQPWELSFDTELALWRIAAALDLEMAAFDLLDAVDGEVFLEVNTHCDWLWSERKSGVSAVSPAVTTLIEDLFQANAPALEESTTNA